MAPTANGMANGTANDDKNEFPSWVNNATLEKAVQAEIGDFEKILSVKPECFGKAGENYSSFMIRLTVEVQLLDGSPKTASFILKAKHTNEAIAKMLDMMQLFQKEEQMYHRILPKFEELYRNAGKEIQFGPRPYRFDRDLGHDYVLLEELKNFKNCDRVVGLDMDHMKEVLIKLAAFHAASACYVEHYGMFGEEFTVGVFSEANRGLLKEFNNSGAFLAQLKKWKDGQNYFTKLADSDDYLVDNLLQAHKVNPREFNVLNHGDCWSNNIMFQYDAFGKIKNTIFIDFQVGKYGSPIYDLYYLILSSANISIKIKKFEFMIKFYYDHLIENLKLLQYQRPLPKLKSLHTALLNNGLSAYMVVSKVLPVVMLEQVDAAKLENFVAESSKMKVSMYTNPKYVQAMEEIMAWLDNRGLLDWK